MKIVLIQLEHKTYYENDKNQENYDLKKKNEQIEVSCLGEYQQIQKKIRRLQEN
jgi:hypothetical protein